MFRYSYNIFIGGHENSVIKNDKIAGKLFFFTLVGKELTEQDIFWF